MVPGRARRDLPLPYRSTAISGTVQGGTLTVTAAARLLGVHANTVRAWTDQGRLTCLRINERGDRRYSIDELQRFLARAHEPSASNAALDVVSEVAALCVADDRSNRMLQRVATLLAERLGFDAVAVIARDGSSRQLLGKTVDDDAAVSAARASRLASRGAGAPRRRSIALAAGLVGGDVLLLQGPARGTLETDAEMTVLAAVAGLLRTTAVNSRRREEAEQDRRRAETLLSVTSEIASRLDLRSVLAKLLEQAVELFGAQHAAVFSRRPNGGLKADATHNLSTAYVRAIESASSLPLNDAAYDSGRIVSVAGFADDPRGAHLREPIRNEGIDTVTVAPLSAGGERIGMLCLYHDSPYSWRPHDLALFEQLARQSSAVLGNARTYDRMAKWAAQLQAIQQLGVRLNGLSEPKQIGQAIALELHQLIDYHNVRVYRVDGRDVLPLAWRGQIGEYENEDDSQLRTVVGEGITGWVAEYGVAQNLGDAAKDPRAVTIPGTEDDLDESMLLAPMLLDGRVTGVIVLSKLGLHQFTDDDQRLLEIFAAIAAQAMANADSAARLRKQSASLARQLNSQRELLRVTESLLGTLDTGQLLEQIADRLTALLPVDNIGIDVYDRAAHTLRPAYARGPHAELYLDAVRPSTLGLAGAAISAAQPQIVHDRLSDPRVYFFEDIGPQPGAMISVPLRARDEIKGVLTIERLGDGADFSDEEFELVKLFAGHLAIALHNAETHHEVEVRAQTDALTGLLNHGSLTESLERAVGRRSPFALLMLDLDNFKAYNDSLGHPAGDALLRRLADVLRQSCRDTDEIYRYGGDEFAVVLPHSAEAGALSVAEKVRRAVRAATTDQSWGIVLTCSIGVASFPADGHDAAAVVLAADRALYVAKRAGRDSIATAAEGLSLAGELLPPPPTPVDAPTYSAEASSAA